MLTAYIVVTVVAIAATGFSGGAALAQFKPILGGGPGLRLVSA